MYSREALAIINDRWSGLKIQKLLDSNQTTVQRAEVESMAMRSE